MYENPSVSVSQVVGGEYLIRNTDGPAWGSAVEFNVKKKEENKKRDVM